MTSAPNRPTRVNCYVDAFNFHYGVLKGGPYKWLNIAEFLRLTLARCMPDPFQIGRVKIFTALLDGSELVRAQKAHLRAMRAAAPNVEIILGKFHFTEARMLDAADGVMRRVVKIEEKGSDVNLALHMLNDAWEDRYDCAAMVSNDSDLAGALRMVRSRGKRAGIVFPSLPSRSPARRRKLSASLKRFADFRARIYEDDLASAQLPSRVVRPDGAVFEKPPAWRKRAAK